MKEKDKRYYSDSFLKSKSASSKLCKQHQEYSIVEPDVKSLPTQNFFENNEIKINIQTDSTDLHLNNEQLKGTRNSNSPNGLADTHNTTIKTASKELNSAKKRFRSAEELLIQQRNSNKNLKIKTTKSLANVVSYSPNDQVPFKTTIKRDDHLIQIDDERNKQFKSKSSSLKLSSSKKHHQKNASVRLNEEPIPSTSTGITHNADGVSNSPPEEFMKKILNVSSSSANTYLHPAKNHDDTSLGAVHCFQDEKGNWLTYTFDENSFGIAQGLKELKKEMTAHDASLNLDDTSLSKQSDRLIHRTNQKESYSSTNNFFIDYEDTQVDKEGNTSINRMQQNAPTTTNDKMDEYCLTYNSPSLQSLNNPNNANNQQQLIQQQQQQRQQSTDLNQSSNVNGLMQNMIMHQNLAFNNNLNSSFANESSINYREFSNPLNRVGGVNNTFSSRGRSKAKPNQFYNLHLPFVPKDKFIKIKLDRLTLLALLDPSLTRLELYMSILLGALVALFGSIIIEEEIFTDLKLIIFCFVIASCQYTLVKSVQPDAASPTHGYNRIIIYSRPVYFILISIITLATKYYREHKLVWSFTLYNTNLLYPAYIEIVEQCMKLTLLLFPIIFTFGFLPQINTFFMHWLEQIDIHCFGGSASTTGLTSAIYSVSRSFLFVLALFGIGLLSISHTLQFKSLNNFSVNDYNAMFSVFCGLLILLAYLLSRYSSDPTDLFNLTKKYFRKLKRFVSRTRRRLKGKSAKPKRLRNTKQDSKTPTTADEETQDLKQSSQDSESTSESETTNSEEEIEYKDPLPKKLERTLIKRLENDLICSIFITIIVFAVHVSTIFKLQPYVDNTLRYLAISLGFFLNYILPQLRKELPWLCFAKPFLKTKERPLFEVKSEAKIMWFDRVRVFLWLFEKNIVYPLVFLSAITIDTPLFLRRFGVK